MGKECQCADSHSAAHFDDGLTLTQHSCFIQADRVSGQCSPVTVGRAQGHFPFCAA